MTHQKMLETVLSHLKRGDEEKKFSTRLLRIEVPSKRNLGHMSVVEGAIFWVEIS